MIKIKGIYEVDRSIFECDSSCYTLIPLNDIGTPNTQTFFEFPRKVSVVPLKDGLI